MYKAFRKGQVKSQSDRKLPQTSLAPAGVLAGTFEMGNVTKVPLLLLFLEDCRLKVLRQHSNKGQYTSIKSPQSISFQLISIPKTFQRKAGFYNCICLAALPLLKCAPYDTG